MPPEQPSLFDDPTPEATPRQRGERERDEALAQVERGAGPLWLDHALAVVKRVAREKGEFTADDLWPFLATVREPRALGTVLKRAKKEGIIEATGHFCPSVRRHMTPLMIWRRAD